MRPARKLALLGLAAVCTYMLCAGPRLTGPVFPAGLVEAEAAENAAAPALTEPSPSPAAPPAGDTPSPSPAPAPEGLAYAALAPLTEPELLPAAAILDSGGGEGVQPTTIQGGLTVKNETRYSVDTARILAQGPQIRLPAEGPQILIVHTHGSEAYTQAGLDRYESNDNNRTADTEFNIIRVGDELARLLEEAGLRVLHDREIYDYPSYTGSYARSGAAVESYLAQYPDIAVVIDLHRDALGSDDVIYKTMAEEEGVCASQVMILVGTDDSGLEHPDWEKNLSLALYLQQAADAMHPTLMRPVSLVRERYNQHLCPGSLIIEVGSSGNTLREALAAIRLFAGAAAPALAALEEPAPADPAEEGLEEAEIDIMDMAV